MWKNRILSSLIFLLLLLAMLMGTLYLLQDRLLHDPVQIDLAKALDVAKDIRLAPWPDAVAPRAWLRETPATTRGTFVVFHDNEGHALMRAWFADGVEYLGYRTLLVEYPGYGHRAGATDEATLSAEAAEIISAIRKKFGGTLIVVGDSFGAGVASAAMAHGNMGVNAVLLANPWNNLASLAAYRYPLWPTRLLLRDHYDSITNLRGFKGPKLVVISENDLVVPGELGRNLFNELDENKKLMMVPDKDHKQWSGKMDPKTRRELVNFLEGH